jgi:hypothetical protein
MFYSKSTGGFYDPAIHGANIPDDARPVTKERHAELLAEQASGKAIIGDVNGDPISVDTSALKSLADLKLDKLRDLETAYAAAIAQPINYMGTTFQADPASVELMNRAINVYTAAGSVPEGFWWLDAENTKVPMTLAQLQGLGQAVADRVWTSFQHLQNLKDAVRDPDLTDPEDLAAIVW